MDCPARKFKGPEAYALKGDGQRAVPHLRAAPLAAEAFDEARLLDAMLRQDLASFTAKVFHTVNPAGRYLDNWHIHLIAEYLTACSKGDIKRLIINLPPRSLKSICVSVAWPAWLMGHRPSKRIMAASYSRSLSIRHALDFRTVTTSPWYGRLFPGFAPAADQNEKHKLQERSLRNILPATDPPCVGAAVEDVLPFFDFRGHRASASGAAKQSSEYVGPSRVFRWLLLPRLPNFLTSTK